jgi:hypothetical protein
MLTGMTRSMFRRITVASTLIVGGIALTTGSPASAAVCTSGVEGDVNGDGYAEVAVSEQGRDFGKGAVHVFYGRTKGLTAGKSGSALDDQYLDQEEPGVAGTGVDHDDFGSALAFGDYNDDGCADLAVGAVSDGESGAVFIFYGSKTGLKTTGSVRFSQEQIVGGDTGPNDPGFGGVLTAADLNDDGVTDLALGVPGKRIDPDNLGTVVVLHGGTGGLDPSRKTVLDRESNDIPDASEVGHSLAAGDFNGNGVEDLAVGLGEGQVQIFEGRASGLETIQGPLTGPDVGVDDFIPDHDGEGDRRDFGNIIVAGDVDHDGHDDLAVGMPFKGLAGTVALVKGSPSGLVESNVPAQTWTQATAGVVGTADEDDAFGASLAMGKLNPGAYDDLVIGVPGDVIDGKRSAGSVNILLGSAKGLTTNNEGGARYDQNSAGVPGTAEDVDSFGRVVAIANVQSKTQGSLIVGVQREKIGKIEAAGQFHQLSIQASGPKTTNSIAFNLDSTGVRGVSRREAELGRALD